MKNLVVLNRAHLHPLPTTHPDVSLSAHSTFDPSTDSITYVFTNKDENNHIEVQQFLKSGTVNTLASFPLESHAPDGTPNHILSFAHFGEAYQLVFVFSNGDIVTATYDESQDVDATVVSIIGTIDSGLLAAEWSPDEETLVLVTKDHKLTLLSRLFEPVAEAVLANTDLLNFHNTNKHVSVGWGKKETQFTGKGMRAVERERDALKHAGADDEIINEMRDPTLGKIERGCVSPYDNPGHHTVSWRGDGEFFAVCLVEESPDEQANARRVVRVYTREGELVSISEPVNNLEGYLSWKPQGSLLASIQRDTNGEDSELDLKVVFFEKNGLRHGEFNLRMDPETRVHNLEWSCDSEILAIQLDDRIQLWTTKNYHWYLKQELQAANLVSFRFHPEKPGQLLLHTDTAIQIVDLTTQVTLGPTFKGHDVGSSLVIDGSDLKFTPLAVANVPPPLSLRDLELVHPVTGIAVNIGAAAVASNNALFAAVGVDNGVYLFGSSTLPENLVRGGKILLVQHWSQEELFDEALTVRQVAFIGNTHVVMVVDTSSQSHLAILNLATADTFVVDTVNPHGPNKIVLLKAQSDGRIAVYETIDGRVFTVDALGTVTERCQFPQLCRDFQASGGDMPVVFGLTASGRLFANDTLLSSSVTSIMITEAFLIVTTAQHQLRFIHLDESVFDSLDDAPVEGSKDERVRQIERGSLLVNAMPSTSRVVLQAPRGNLETIHPRIMVLSEVRLYLKRTQYYNAFRLCRTHRIDLDILHDYDPQGWAANLPKFIEGLGLVEYLDLFVSCLREEDVCETKYRETRGTVDDVAEGVARVLLEARGTSKPLSKINAICTLILELLTQPAYEATYLQTILTTFACQSPPNLAGALTLVGSFTSDQLEKAVTHLCFLQDVNALYTVALGLYDVRLALTIAQKSQKDPKEYLPFLQHLHAQLPLRKRFLIDSHLKNHAKALRHLCEEVPSAEGNAEIDEFVVEHELYKLALDLYRYDALRSHQILALHAAFLKEQQLYAEAGLVFETLGVYPEAVECYLQAKRWREALTVATLHASSLVENVAGRLVEVLTDNHQYAAAADIELRFLNNVEAAVTLYCKNYHYDEALLLCATRNQPELLEALVDPQLGEGFGVIAELLADCMQQSESQLRRLRDLRTKKQENPYEFYGNEQSEWDTPDNVSIAASETSTTPSFFTRYTGKTSGTAQTGVSRKSSKNRKREERKRAKGRKGTIYEEEYLIKSVGRLLERLHDTIPDATRLVEGLLRRGMKQQAHQIQQRYVEVLAFLKDHIVEIHDISAKDRERVNDDGEVYLIPELPVPEIKVYPLKETLDF